MICPNCGKETKGIKLNGKIFCTFCGELVKDPTAILEESYKIPEVIPENLEVLGGTSPSPKIINPDGSEKISTDEQDLLEAEEEVLEAIEDKLKIDHPLNNVTIGKHNRKRADQNFEIIAGEPDPISEPEIEAPHDILLEDEPEGSEPEPETTNQSNFPLMPKADKDSLKKKQKTHQDVFKNFLKETGSAVSYKPKKEKKKPRKNKSHKIFWIVFAIAALSMLLGGLVYYVNVVAINEDRILSDIEGGTTLVYQKPINTMTGYQISYLSESRDDFIRYYYTKKGNKKAFLSIDIQKTNYKASEIQEKIITPLNTSYTVSKVDGLEIWQTNTNQIFVIQQGVLYAFAYTDDLADETVLLYTQEMLL